MRRSTLLSRTEGSSEAKVLTLTLPLVAAVKLFGLLILLIDVEMGGSLGCLVTAIHRSISGRALVY